ESFPRELKTPQRMPSRRSGSEPRGRYHLSGITLGCSAGQGLDANNKLLWVNRGVNAAPTAGQASPYTLFSYDADGRMTHRERKFDSGLLRSYDFKWDADNRLREVDQGGVPVLTASYNGGGLRVNK